MDAVVPAAQRDHDPDPLRRGRTRVTGGPSENLDFVAAPQAHPAAPRKPVFGYLVFLGFPWNLSTESSLFNGLRATSGDFYLQTPLSLRYEIAPSKGRSKALTLRLNLA